MGGLPKAAPVSTRMSTNRNRLLLPFLGLSLAAGWLAISHQSLWIDEANSALKAMQPSLSGWWQVLVAEKGSDLQMPLYMLWLWAWEKIAGHSEFALRAANLPWLLLAHWALYRAASVRRAPFLPLLLVASLNPFLWFYLDEARPYVMQYAAAWMISAFLFRTAVEDRRGTDPGEFSFFAIGLVVLCGSSLLGVIWAAFAGAAWLYLIRNRLRLLLRTPLCMQWVAMGLCLSLLGIYYAWTLKAGARASNAVGTGLLNIGFIGYELLGAAGLGPGRIQLREDGLGAVSKFGVGLIPLGLGALVLTVLFGFGLVCAWRLCSRREIMAGALYAIPPALLLFALGSVQHFRVLGRHFMPVAPVILGVFFLGLSRMTPRPARMGWSALAAVWLASSLSLRFCERHRKDDYREAARIARAALEEGHSVWWFADPAAAKYYRLPLGDSSRSASVPSAAQIATPQKQSSVPDLVVLSKPDLYDSAGEISAFLREHRFQDVRDLPAFTIWRKAAPAPAVR